MEVSASGGVMVRDWDHVSYFTLLSSCRSFWLQLAPLVLASIIPMEGEVLVEADYSPNFRQWPGPWYELRPLRSMTTSFQTTSFHPLVTSFHQVVTSFQRIVGKIVKRFVITWRCCRDESSLFWLLWSHLFAFMFNLNMISHIRQSKTNKYCKERLT